MPNWCNNNISISGPKAKIEALYNEAIQDADDETGLLNAMYPMPPELNDTTSPTPEDAEVTLVDGHSDWYSWRVANWSTKWEVSSEGLEFTDLGDGTAELSGWFDSAWSPPIGAYERFLEANPDCEISASYYEPGMDFAGFWINGEDEFLDGCYEEFKLPEEEQSELYKRLDEEYNLSENYDMWEEDE